MKTVSKWWLALGLAVVGMFVSQEAVATPTCYQAVGVEGRNADAYVGTLQLIPASCLSTPEGHGWYWISDAPYELHVAIPYAWPLKSYYVIYYAGEGSSYPVILSDIVVGSGDDPLPLDPDPPGAQNLCQVATDRALVPAMTGSTAPSGTVTSSGTYSSSYTAWKALDGTTGTSWLSNENTSSVWIAYEWGGGAASVVKSYQIRYANGSCCQQRGPKNFTLQGWNGSAWIVVDTVTAQTGWYANSTRTYTVDNPGAYGKYRLHITADNYNSSSHSITLVSIAEVQLYGQAASPLVPAMTGSTAPSGAVSSSGIYASSYEDWKAFDGTTGYAWLSNSDTSSVWIAYEWGGGASKAVNSYRMVYSNGSCCQQRGPKNWTLQGWDGSAWITVDTVSNQTGWYASPNRTFSVDSPGCYAKYRLHITADNYNSATYPITLVSLGELLLYGDSQ